MVDKSGFYAKKAAYNAEKEREEKRQKAEAEKIAYGIERERLISDLKMIFAQADIILKDGDFIENDNGTIVIDWDSDEKFVFAWRKDEQRFARDNNGDIYAYFEHGITGRAGFLHLNEDNFEKILILTGEDDGCPF